MYTFSSICKNVSALGVRNILRSIEFFIRVQFSLHASLLNTVCYPYNTPEPSFPCFIRNLVKG